MSRHRRATKTAPFRNKVPPRPDAQLVFVWTRSEISSAEAWARKEYGEGGFKIEIRATPEAMRIATEANPKAVVYKFRQGR